MAIQLLDVHVGFVCIVPVAGVAHQQFLDGLLCERVYWRVDQVEVLGLALGVGTRFVVDAQVCVAAVAQSALAVVTALLSQRHLLAFRATHELEGRISVLDLLDVFRDEVLSNLRQPLVLVVFVVETNNEFVETVFNLVLYLIFRVHVVAVYFIST